LNKHGVEVVGNNGDFVPERYNVTFQFGQTGNKTLQESYDKIEDWNQKVKTIINNFRNKDSVYLMKT